MKKRVLSLILTTAMAAALMTGYSFSVAAADSDTGESAETLEDLPEGDWVIGLSNSYYGNTWRKQMVTAFEESANQAKEAGLISDFVVMNGDNTVNAQISQIESMILQGVDAICINAASPTALNSVLQKAMDAGIKVISFDSNVESLPGCYVMDYDMTEYGRMQGRFIVDKFDGEANVVAVRGISGSTPANKIYEGYMEVFEENEGINVLCEVNGEASTTVTQEELLKVIGNLDHVDAVVVNGGGDSYGVVNAFEQLGMEVPVVIGDGSGEFINWWLQQKEASGYETISINCAPSCASAAFWTVLKILDGEDIPEYLELALATVTQDNVEEYDSLEAGAFVAPEFSYEFTVENVIKPSLELADN